MIDALVYAVRDWIIGSNIGYGYAECDIMDDGQPPPRCGNYFAAIHGGIMRSDRDNQLYERYEICITLTMRIVVPMDKAGNQQIYLRMVRDEARKRGFNAKCEQLRSLVHMNWAMVVQPGQTPPSANDNLCAWAPTGVSQIYGFAEPLRFRTMEIGKLCYDDWFGTSAPQDTEDDRVPLGIKSELKFRDALRFQPQTQANGPSV